MNPHDEKNREFVETLVKLCDDRGHAAALRRWWSSATEHQALQTLGRLRAIGDWPRSTIAALYAVHPQDQKNGPGLGRAALLLGDRKDGEHPYDRHFRRLLAARTEKDLQTQLHRLVKRLHNEGFALDYAGLLRDLRLWKSGLEQKVKVRWAMEFWQTPAEFAP